MDIIRELENEQLKSEVTPFNVGDTIRVYAKVVEGTRERLQMFEGVVIKRQGGGIRETFTVRRIASGVGVERTSRTLSQNRPYRGCKTWCCKTC